MTAIEAEESLKTLTVLRDSREQATGASAQRYESMGVPVHKATLSYGDYAGNVRMPDGTWLYDESETIRPSCVVERKMSLGELAGCFVSGKDPGRNPRRRFQAEFERAKEAGAKTYLVVEDATWGKVFSGNYASHMHVNAFFASIITWMVRYETPVIFCQREQSGRIIKEILYRDMKERLEGMVE